MVDSCNHRVQLFGEQGEYLNSNQCAEQGNLDSQLDSPRGLSLATVGNILVADSDNKVVEIFSNGSQILRKIGGHNSVSFPGYGTYRYFILQNDSF